MDRYLAVDLGTTGCRSILFDAALNELGAAYEEYPLSTPREGWAEQDAELWWELTLRTAKAAIAKAGADPKSVAAISVSSQGITVVPVDEHLEPLCPALSWLDVRARAQAEQLERELGAAWTFGHTGKRIDPCYTLPKVLWLRQERPELWAKTRKLLMPMDYLIARLTGVCLTDHSMASGTLMYDLKNCCWSREILSKYDISPDLLPPLRYSGETAGAVLPEAAALLGLRSDCVVAVGAQDQKCAALGAGLREGTMTVSLGTAAAVTKLWDRPLTERYDAVGWCGYVAPGAWVTEGVINTAGTCLRWVRDLLFPADGYDAINAEAAKAREGDGRVLFLPYLNGPGAPDYFPDARGCFLGMSLATGRGELALAVMEGVALQLRALLEAMGAYGSVERLVFFGGGAKSPLWAQIIADATGMELVIPSSAEAAVAGAAMLAARAAGAELAPLPPARTFRPERSYDEKYRAFRAAAERLWKQEEA